MALFFHPRAPARRLALRHEELEDALRRLALLVVQPHLDEAPRVRMHRRLAELLGIHLAQALEAAGVDKRVANALVAKLLEDLLALRVIQRVEAPLGLHLAVGRHADAVERRLGDENVTALDELREVAVEKREEERLDVRAVHVRV